MPQVPRRRCSNCTPVSHREDTAHSQPEEVLTTCSSTTQRRARRSHPFHELNYGDRASVRLACASKSQAIGTGSAAIRRLTFTVVCHFHRWCIIHLAPPRTFMVEGRKGRRLQRHLRHTTGRRDARIACAAKRVRKGFGALQHGKPTAPPIAQIGQLYASSIFCLQPPGDAVSRKGVVDALLLGCIPVLFHIGQVKQWPWHRAHGRATIYRYDRCYSPPRRRH